MEYLVNEKNAGIILEISDNIHQNEKYLSELDGAAGDGDHGVNMNKGFSLAKERIQTNMSFSEGLNILRKVLMEEIGGSMGPIYGTLFTKIYRTIKRENIITAELFLSALHNAVTGLMDLGGAKVGDKTLLDTLCPATEAFKKALENGNSFTECLTAMSVASIKGKESTKLMVAKVGRASRLGERSRGHIDAGAASCCVILTSMADAIQEVMVLD
ncbi:dihydroxyacetone kinase subunit L [Faecalicoccus pleomorphus]|uniref:phosphoenolpyruvate--glycerone phosphotransferase n=1 Tax=Faecalicoccus pleomorphus TaxID=1323 RepID=A0A7X9NGW6_9FIRM|nr:dihydroxyacetone kinase subunit DhaL [Faecalicoccus pleomorphus]NME44053.1 dihydroxyacetone kinase subunit L [Faecalicoccus pleomorphus]